MTILKRKFIFESSLGQSVSFGLDQDFVIKHIDGIDSNRVDLSTSKSVGQIGDTVNNIDIKSKSITIEGFIKTNDLNLRYDALNKIIPGDIGKLSCILETGESLYLDVVVKNSPTIENKDCMPKFQLEFTTEYPFWRASESERSVVSGLIPLFRYPRNTGNPTPWRFSKYPEGELTYITNYGNYEVGIKITILAKQDISGFKIQDANTLEYIALKPSYTIRKDEVVTITTGYNNKKIVSSTNGNIIKFMDLDSTFLQLKPGANTFKYTLTQDKTLAEVTIEYDTIKVGI